ncbi:MAG: RIP metalloprotease RseP [Desulfovibrionaceae bacterium]|nr:RIP metalloprotease RseP [Desulfovibrionaceae bacterium]
MLTIIAVVVVFGGLIFFHELGHFAVARALGMGVSTFSLGFGPKILKKRRGKTEYALSLIPLGGYVALVGETDEADIPEGFTKEESFALRPAWQRLLVVLAGPAANMLLAVILCIMLAMGWGVSTMLANVGEVSPDSPAARAGILKGDTVVSINGEAIDSWSQMSDRITSSGGSPLLMEIERRDDRGGISVLEFTVEPERSERKTIFGETETAWLIGVRSSGAYVTRELGMAGSIRAGWNQCMDMISLTWQGFVKLVQRVVPADQVGGPIMIAQVISEQASADLAGLLGLAALISVNLGILNLLPVPVLDGGTAVFCLWEMIFRRPLNQKVQAYSLRVGVALLVCLMLFATFNDVMRLLRG